MFLIPPSLSGTKPEETLQLSEYPVCRAEESRNLAKHT